MTVDCDSPQCHNRHGRVWTWLEGEPGPWLTGFVWGLLAAGLLWWLGR